MGLDVATLAERVIPILAFLVAITVVAEICDAAGLFDEAAHLAARLAQGRLLLLWLLLVVLAGASTVILSLDTTAVLLTPVAITVARQVGAPPLPFAMTTLWLANTASLLLPVSNLTNLLALHPLGLLGLGHRDYIVAMARPAAVAVLVTALLLWLLHRRDLRGRFTSPPRAEPHDRGLLRIAAWGCVLLGVAFVLGVPPWLAAAPAALLLACATLWRAPELLREVAVPWRTVIGLCVLFVVVDAALRLGLQGWLQTLAGHGTGSTDLLRVSGLGAVAANGVNNLPAYLALEPTASNSLSRLAALLVGVNTGPLVTMWGSVATILWLGRCRSAQMRVDLGRVALSGALCAVSVVLAATLTLAATIG